MYYCVYTHMALCMPHNTESTHIMCTHLICLYYAYLYTYSQFVLCTKAVFVASTTYTAWCFYVCGHSVIILYIYVVKLYKCSNLIGHSQVLRPVRASQSPSRWGLSCVGQLCSVSCSAVLLFLWRSLLGTLSAMRHTKCIASHQIIWHFLWTFRCPLLLMAEE